MSAPTDVPRGTRRAQTYLPQSSDRDEILGFADFIRDIEQHLEDGERSKAALVDPTGEPRPIPDEIFRILEQVTDALASGHGITVVPEGMAMTTQQAADYLGVSRPTLVRLLESGKIPFDKPGRHRRVMLKDLVEYQEQFRQERRAALRSLAQAGVESSVLIGSPADVRRLSELDEG